MTTRIPCATGEWYHCYNRGVDKRTVFADEKDYNRFISLLYACNGTKAERISDRFKKDLSSLLSDTSVDRGEPLVDIAVYSLMPNHMHIVLLQLIDGGIARFMQKVFTGYTMYFNSRNERAGSLFAGTYKAKHIDTDEYLKQVIPYVLLNPLELFEPAWKKGGGNLAALEKKLLEYPYSNVRGLFDEESIHKKITGSGIYEYFERLPPLADMVKDAKKYYSSLLPSEV